MFYDIIIIGGGISGIYTAYKINQSHPEKTILLLEKESTLGGRVFTYHDKNMQVEAGAGRFHNGHTLLLELIEELHLTSKLNKISSSAVYSPSDGTSSIENSVLDAPSPSHEYPDILEPLFARALDIGLGKETLPNAELITKLVIASKFESKETLINQSLESYARTILTPEETEYIKDTFGYYSELVIMNAYDALQLIPNLGPLNQFYSLQDGLSQIIVKMVHQMKKNPRIKIQTKKTVANIIPIQSGGFRIKMAPSSNKTKKQVPAPNKTKKQTNEIANEYTCKTCVCALPREALESIALFRPLSPLLKQVEYGSLCRIYCKFKPDSNGKQWFENLPKMTTNNNLRMIIPINTKKGIIMMSYSDNKYADYWNKLYNKKGMVKMVEHLQYLGEQTTGIKIPSPVDTKIFYWKYGVGYWGIHADSEKVSKQIIKPFENQELFICGENYSEKNQQWMEGALETSKHVMEQIRYE